MPLTDPAATCRSSYSSLNMAASVMSMTMRTGLAMLDFAKWCLVVERQVSVSLAGPVSAKEHELLAPGLRPATSRETAPHLPFLVVERMTRLFLCFLSRTRVLLLLGASAPPPRPSS